MKEGSCGLGGAQAMAHAEAQAALRESLIAEATTAAADVSAERLRKLDDALSDRSARLLQDNARLRAELKVHAQVPPTLLTPLTCMLMHPHFCPAIH